MSFHHSGEFMNKAETKTHEVAQVDDPQLRMYVLEHSGTRRDRGPERFLLPTCLPAGR